MSVDSSSFDVGLAASRELISVIDYFLFFVLEAGVTL